MPASNNRRKKNKKRRDRDQGGASSGEGGGGGGGGGGSLMSMRSGMKKAAGAVTGSGAETPEPSGRNNLVWNIVTGVAVVAAILIVYFKFIA